MEKQPAHGGAEAAVGIWRMERDWGLPLCLPTTERFQLRAVGAGTLSQLLTLPRQSRPRAQELLNPGPAPRATSAPCLNACSPLPCVTSCFWSPPSPCVHRHPGGRAEAALASSAVLTSGLRCQAHFSIADIPHVRLAGSPGPYDSRGLQLHPGHVLRASLTQMSAKASGP